MEKCPRGSTISKRKMKSSSTLCIPRFKPHSKSAATRLSPMTMLERFREAVFRLIMLSAITKASATSGGSPEPQERYYPLANDHHSEAVADCIEFIKQKAVTEESHGAATELVMPVPVM